MHAVLDTKPGSKYDDVVSQRYHFPSRYLKILESCIGEWIVYREPRADGGSMAYIAAAKVDRIYKDPDERNHYYASISHYEEFDHKVEWQLHGRYWEKALRDLEPRKVGVYMRGRSVRELDVTDFTAIVGVATLQLTLSTDSIG